MPAAYSSGAASSAINLLQALVTFLTAQGWTSDSSVADSSGWRAHLHKGSVYVNLRASMNEAVWPAANHATGYSLNLYLGTGYSGASAWHAQAGGPVRNGGTDTVGVGVCLLNGAVASHHFFDDGADNIVVVVERTAGVYGYLGFGPSVNKLGGSWTGGPYFFGSSGGYRANSTTDAPGASETAATPFNAGQSYAGFSTDPWATYFVRADVDAFTGLWLSGSKPPAGTTAASSGQSGYTGKVMIGALTAQFTSAVAFAPDPRVPGMSIFQGRITAPANGEAILLPVPLYAEMDDANAGLLGVVDSIYLSNAVGNGYAGKDVITRAGRDYMVFPNFAVFKGA